MHVSFFIQVSSNFISYEKVARIIDTTRNLESVGVTFGASNTIFILLERLFKFNRNVIINHFKSYVIAHKLKVVVGGPILAVEFEFFTLFNHSPIMISIFEPLPVTLSDPTIKNVDVVDARMFAFLLFNLILNLYVLN